MEPMTVGVIGCGNISDAYLRGAARSRLIEVKSCADLNPEAAKAKAEEYGIEAVSVDALLGDPAIDIVINLAPVVTAGLDQTATEGSTVNLTLATFTDVGPADTHTVTIAWGDGKAPLAGLVHSRRAVQPQGQQRCRMQGDDKAARQPAVVHARRRLRS